MSLSYVKVDEAPWEILVPGVHTMSLSDFKSEFAYNDVRREQFDGLVRALRSLKAAGCENVYIDGSYVTKKPVPGDFDACWDRNTVSRNLLDPVLLDFSYPRAAQKRKYLGELFISDFPADPTSNFFEFFQKVKDSNEAKGIVGLNLLSEDLSQF